MDLPHRSPYTSQTGFPNVAFMCGCAPQLLRPCSAEKASLAMTVPLNRFLVLVAAALTLLTVMLATAYAVYTQSGDYSCAAGEAVVEPDNNPGLVSDCTALLAVIRLYFADGST